VSPLVDGVHMCAVCGCWGSSLGHGMVMTFCVKEYDDWGCLRWLSGGVGRLPGGVQSFSRFMRVDGQLGMTRTYRAVRLWGGVLDRQEAVCEHPSSYPC
jgi:hypothetical protein